MPGLAAATLLNLTGHAPAPHHHPDCLRCDARTTKQAYAHVPRYPSLAATSSDYRPSRRCKKGPVTQLVQSQHQRHPTRVQRFGRRIERATQRGNSAPLVQPLPCPFTPGPVPKGTRLRMSAGVRESPGGGNEQRASVGLVWPPRIAGHRHVRAKPPRLAYAALRGLSVTAR